METPEARLRKLIETIAKDEDKNTDINMSKHEKPWHEWIASQQSIVRNLVPIGTVLQNLHIPGPESDMIQRVTNLTAKEQTYILDTTEEATNKLYGSISSVLQEDAFQSWFKGRFSSTTIILGASRESSCPISYMCATLGRKLSQMPYILPLTFFCQLHLEGDDPLRGLEGMMRSLIAQLLAHKSGNRFITNKLTLEQWELGQIPLDNAKKLFQHFASLVKSVTAGTIICIIDGIDYFANPTRTRSSDDADCVMKGFRELMKEVDQAREDNEGKLRLKLLLTIHEPSRHIESQFTEGTATLLLPEVPAGEGRANKRRAEELAEARAGKRRAY